MKLENQVTSVELSNKLLDLGVRKPSQFYRDWRGAGEGEILMWENPDGDVCLDNVNCYTVAELGEMFPAVIQTGATLSQVGTGKTTNEQGYGCSLIDANRITIHRTFQADTEANVRAKMLIYLLENNLITSR